MHIDKTRPIFGIKSVSLIKDSMAWSYTSHSICISIKIDDLLPDKAVKLSCSLFIMAKIEQTKTVEEAVM